MVRAPNIASIDYINTLLFEITIDILFCTKIRSKFVKLYYAFVRVLSHVRIRENEDVDKSVRSAIKNIISLLLMTHKNLYSIIKQKIIKN